MLPNKKALPGRDTNLERATGRVGSSPLDTTLPYDFTITGANERDAGQPLYEPIEPATLLNVLLAFCAVGGERCQAYDDDEGNYGRIFHWGRSIFGDKESSYLRHYRFHLVPRNGTVNQF